MEIDKVVICPQGWMINVDDIRTIGPVEAHTHNNVHTHYKFTLYYKYLDKSHNFYYKLTDFSDSKEELLIKVQNIRYEIIKLMNGGREVKPISAIIKLNKKNV
jgi:hypothetical protein